MADFYIVEGSADVGTPGDGDNVFLLGGSGVITTNLDKSALTNGFAIFEIARPFTGTYGSAANPMYVEVTTRLVYAARAGAMFYRGKDSGDATPLIQVNTGGKFEFVDGTATRFEVAAGFAQVDATAIATNIRIGGGGSLSLLDDSSTDPTLLHIMGSGTAITERGGTTFTNDGGNLTIDAGANAITTLNCRAHGKTILTESGTITTCNCDGHVPDTSALIRPLTISATNINMLLPNAQAFLDHPLITHSSVTRYVSDGRIWS